MKTWIYTLEWEQCLAGNRGVNMKLTGDYDSVRHAWALLCQPFGPDCVRNVVTSVDKDPEAWPTGQDLIEKGLEPQQRFEVGGPWPRNVAW